MTRFGSVSSLQKKMAVSSDFFGRNCSSFFFLEFGNSTTTSAVVFLGTLRERACAVSARSRRTGDPLSCGAGGRFGMANLAKLTAFSLAVAFAVVWAYGVFHVLSPSFGGPNQCEMSYMRPSYLAVPLPPSVKNHRGYELFLYREAMPAGSSGQTELDGLGKPIADDGDGTFGKFKSHRFGTPVFFLPGNGGSYKQVRSLGAETQRMRDARLKVLDNERREKERQERHSDGDENPADGESRTQRDGESVPSLDWFSLSFNQELCAFHAGLLKTQTEFTFAVIKHVLSLYPKDTQRHVIIVGHSMGGIVGRAAVLEMHREREMHPNQNLPFLSTLLTLATPHRASPAATTVSLGRLLNKLNHEWQRPGFIKNTNLVSILGGDRDRQVRREHARVAFLGGDNEKGEHENESKNVFAFAVDVARLDKKKSLSADHQCVVWCNQVVKAVAFALIDVVGVSGVVTSGENPETAARNARDVLRRALLGEAGNATQPSGVKHGSDADVTEEPSLSVQLCLARFVITATPCLGPIAVAVAFLGASTATPRRRVRRDAANGLSGSAVFVFAVLAAVCASALHPGLGMICGVFVRAVGIFRRGNRKCVWGDRRELSRLIAHCVAAALTTPSLVASVHASIRGATGFWGDRDVWWCSPHTIIDTTCASVTCLAALVEVVEPGVAVGEADVFTWSAFVVAIRACVDPTRAYRVQYATAIDSAGVCLGSLGRWRMRGRFTRGKEKTR